jgi:hypothetical protein
MPSWFGGRVVQQQAHRTAMALRSGLQDRGYGLVKRVKRGPLHETLHEKK